MAHREREAPRTPSASRPIMEGYGLLPADEGAGLLPWTWATERLGASRDYWLASVHPAGRPHVMPVWGVWVDDVLCFSTGAQTRKARNLAACADCTVTTENGAEPVIVEGVARILDRVPAHFAEAYQKKYDWAIDGQPGLIYAIAPRRVFGFIEAPSDFAGSATRWEFPIDDAPS